MNSDDLGMDAAIAAAKKAYDAEEIPVGAAILYKEQVIASAGNEREIRRDPLAHAEMLAISQAARLLGRRRLSGCTLYVTLEPCPMCAGAALAAGLDRIVFGTADPKAGCCGSVYAIPEDPAFGKGIPCDGPYSETECQKLLHDFFERRRKIDHSEN